MFKRFSMRVSIAAVVGAIAALFWMPLGTAQTTIRSTTLSAAITSTDQSLIDVTSATNIAVGDVAFVDREAMRVRAVDTTNNRLTVRRGQEGTAAATHASGAVIFADDPSYFAQRDLAGTCTLSAQISQPRIVLASGKMFDCVQGRWQERLHQPFAVTGTMVVTGKAGARDSFDQGYLLMMDTGVVTALTDDLDTFVYGSPLGAIEFREELTKTASSWVTSAGRLNIAADDTTDDEGVEIIFGASELNGSYFVAGTTGACISASITLTDISGTDQLAIGFRDSSAFVDVNAYQTYTIWNTVGVNNVDGSIVSLQEVSEALDSDDSGVNWADGETRALKVCVTAAGVPSAFYTDAVTLGSQEELYPKYKAITMTETGSTLTAAQAMVPFLTFMTAGTDGPSPFVNWLQLEPH